MRSLRCPSRDLYTTIPQEGLYEVMCHGLHPGQPLTYYRRQAVHDAPAHVDSVLVRVDVHDAMSDGVPFYAGEEQGTFKVNYLSPAFLYVVENVGRGR